MRGVLKVQRCVDYRALDFPAATVQPYGMRSAPEWVEVSGRGSIWSFAVPHPPLTPQFAALAPYAVVVVALEEDPTIRFVGNWSPTSMPDQFRGPGDTANRRAGTGSVRPPLTSEIRLPQWVRSDSTDAFRGPANQLE